MSSGSFQLYKSPAVPRMKLSTPYDRHPRGSAHLVHATANGGSLLASRLEDRGHSRLPGHAVSKEFRNEDVALGVFYFDNF